MAAVAVVTGATLQRSTGLGFTLVSGPFLVLVLSPYEGVALANLLSLVTCCIVLAATYRRVELRSAGWLIAGVAISIVPGAMLVRALPAPALLVVVGALATLAAGVVAVGRPITALSRPSGPVVAGFASGFSNVTAGVGGPALAVYGASTNWSRQTFVPTVQLVLIVTNGLSLVAKHDARLPMSVVASCLAAVLVGAVAGRYTAALISERWGRATVLTLAIVGGLASVAKGIATW